MHEENHDEVDTSWYHADPGQRPPVGDAVPQPEDDEHPDADEQGLKDGQAAPGAGVHGLGDVNTLNSICVKVP